jgi:hypothetical protein
MSSDKDINIFAGNLIPSGAPTLKKPPYLIVMERTEKKTQVIERFISLDKPSSQLNGFIEVKGIYTDKTEEEVIKSFNEILANTPKEAILEMMFPIHRIISIRSLIFNAVKGAQPILR